MRLELSGAADIAAPRREVWERLMDPQFLAGFAPGVESVQALDATRFKVITGVGLGAVRLRFKLDVELSGVVPPERLRMSARGRAPGSAVDVACDVRLAEAGDCRTLLYWSAGSTISGVLAGVGGRLLEGTVRRLTEEFWNDFARRVGAG